VPPEGEVPVVTSRRVDYLGRSRNHPGILKKKKKKEILHDRRDALIHISTLRPYDPGNRRESWVSLFIPSLFAWWDVTGPLIDRGLPV